jgi:heat-inducible transcriptional repressor
VNNSGISERKQKILHAVVTDYIQTAEPVGSRTISRRYRMDLSAATIRNEMADLEEMGYLSQPHTSAGRIPSQSGYRFYVDYLMNQAELTVQEEEYIRRLFLQLEKMREIDQIIQQTARILSQLTNYTSLILGPLFSRSAFKQLRLIPLDGNKALAVLITDAGFIKNSLIDLPRALSEEELHRIVSCLNEQMAGLTIESLTASRLRQLRGTLYDRLDILNQALAMLEEVRNENENRVYLGGTSNILNQPEFQDLIKVRNLLSLFEGYRRFNFLLETPMEGVTIRIGTENSLQEMNECSLVTATYLLHGHPVGAVGVLGPTRMEYARVVTMIEHITVRLNNVLKAL